MRPSTTASPPVQPIRSSSSGTGSVSTTYDPKLVTHRATGRHPVAAAFTATTTDCARTRPPLVRTLAPSIRSAGDRSYSSTPRASAAARSARTSRAGWTVAHSRKKTPRRKAGERTRCATSSVASGTASSAAPSSAAAVTAESIARSCAGAVDTINNPPVRSPTSSPSARTAGRIRSPACASARAPSSPSTARVSARLAQYPWMKPPFRPLGPAPQRSASTRTTCADGSRSSTASAVQRPV